jgi:DNA polymerase-1
VVDFLLIDGHQLAFRCFYGVGELSRSDGFPTGALHGYIHSILRMREEVRPRHTVVFFDHGRCLKRLQLLPTYKGQRAPMPENMRLQLPHMREVVPLLGAVKIEREGTEADDLLASLATRESNRGKSSLIASSDKDFAQLVCDRIKLHVPPASRGGCGRWTAMDADAVEKKFGVRPQCIVDYLSLVGDSSDNIPGVPGVGAKTASEWLRLYGSIEGIRQHLGALSPRLAKNFLASEEILARTRELIRFETAMDVPESDGEQFDGHALKNFLRTFELDKLASKFFLE